MDKEHVISDEALAEIQAALLKNQHWMAFNEVNYFLGKENMYFFKNKEEAGEFAAGNISEFDSYNVLHFESVADVFRKISYGESINEQLLISSQQNHTIMNEENVAYLEKNLLYSGFGDKLNAELKEQIGQSKPEFQLEHRAKIGEEETTAKLYFRKSDTTDHYFFNKYDMALRSPAEHGERSQTFYMDKGKSNITAKEAYNLLAGRSVYKEMTNKQEEKYHCWLQLNFELKDKHGNHLYKQYHDNYGFNLKEALAKHSINEMQYPNSAEMLVKSLQKGNLQSVILERDGKDGKHFIEANPQFKSINVYDGEMKLVINKTQKQEQAKEQKQEQKEGHKKDQQEDQKQDKKKDQQVKREDSPEKQSRSKSRSR